MNNKIVLEITDINREVLKLTEHEEQIDLFIRVLENLTSKLKGVKTREFFIVFADLLFEIEQFILLGGGGGNLKYYIGNILNLKDELKNKYLEKLKTRKEK